MSDLDRAQRKAQRMAKRSAPAQLLIAVALATVYALFCGFCAASATFVTAGTPGHPDALKAPEWLRPTLFVVVGVVVFVLTFLGIREEHRQARASLTTARHSETQVARTRVELADIEQAITDRSVEYAELGRRVQEASAMLAATEAQISYVRRAVEQAVARSQRSLWLSILAFAAGILLGYVTEWTADGIKPSWLP